MKIRPLHDRVVIKRMEEEKASPGGIIIPDSATLAPTHVAENNTTFNFRFWTSTPSLKASDSPSCKTSIFLEIGSIKSIEPKIKIIAGEINNQFEAPKLPIIQKVKPLNWESVLT